MYSCGGTERLKVENKVTCPWPYKASEFKRAYLDWSARSNFDFANMKDDPNLCSSCRDSDKLVHGSICL